MFEKDVMKIRALGIGGTIIGVILVAIGVAGFFLPIIPGFIFFFAGMLILGIELKFLEKWKRKVFGKG
jgi:uncharacterized protein YqgC (DUF456 family)